MTLEKHYPKLLIITKTMYRVKNKKINKVKHGIWAFLVIILEKNSSGVRM